MRRLKLHLLQLARTLGLFWLARAITGRGLRILCYHGIWLGSSRYPGDSMFMSRATFEQRLETIRRLGYPVIPLSQAVEALRGQSNAPDAAVVITIDDGWYSTYEAMVPALKRQGMPATLYCDTAHLMDRKPIAHMMARYILRLSGPAPEGSVAHRAYLQATDLALPADARIAAVRDLATALDFDMDQFVASRAFEYMTEIELKETFASGVDVQLHTHNHTLHDMSAPAVRNEIEANRSALAGLLSQPPHHFQHFCYPSGVTSASAAQALADLGLRSSTTTLPGLAFKNDPLHLISRFVDGEQVTQIEFEAELSGFMHFVRKMLALKLRLTSGPGVAPPDRLLRT